MDSGIPAVKSLVQNGASKVPSRFIRAVHERPASHKALIQEELPIIDASRLHEEPELEKLYKACSDWGFFQLINHGVPSALLQSTREVIKGFFNLPEQEKEKYTGFFETTQSKEGYGRYFLPSEETPLDWGDVFFHFLPPAVIPWPAHPPHYKATINEYVARVKPLILELLAALSIALHQPPELFSKAFGSEHVESLRMNYYPPCPEPDVVLGLTAHSDAVGITILLQDEVEGLQIKRNGKWKDVESIPDAFVVNIGDILEIMSNGAYKSVEHRAVVGPQQARISAAMFYSPAFDAKLKPLLVDEEPRFKELSFHEFLQALFSKELNGKSQLDIARLQKEGTIGESVTSCYAFGVFEVHAGWKASLKNLAWSLQDLEDLNMEFTRHQPVLFFDVPTFSTRSFQNVLSGLETLIGELSSKSFSDLMDSGIPAVQSLVQNGATKVPSRFIRKTDDRPGVHEALIPEELPIIDASRLNQEPELEKLYKACTEWGFFQLINHGVPSGLLQSTREVIKGFFDLPEPEKEKNTGFYEMTNTKEGYGRYFLPSEDTVLDWVDVFFHFLPPAVIPWPSHAPEYKETIEEYAAEVKSLALDLLAALSLALHQPPEFFSTAFGPEHAQSLRMNYYPPCPEPDVVLGLTAHSDVVGITILLQDEVEGLQIKRNGKWKAVESIPDAFVVNIGDVLEIMSNGTYKSVEHRVVVGAQQARISAAMFYSPAFDARVKPLLLDEEPRFKEMSFQEFLQAFLSKELSGKSQLDIARL